MLTQFELDTMSKNTYYLERIAEALEKQNEILSKVKQENSKEITLTFDKEGLENFAGQIIEIFENDSSVFEETEYDDLLNSVIECINKWSEKK